MLLDLRGNILTNDHVVTLESRTVAQMLQVTLWNGKTVKARIVGHDQATDLAVIQVDPAAIAGARPVTWADPTTVHAGEQVVAIGYAMNLDGDPTVSSGLVSATERTVPEEDGATLTHAIQTDASVTHGNSGGPLFDLRGHVVGVITAGIPTQDGSGTVPGMNVAISVGTAQPVANALIAGGRVARASMGVTVNQVTEDLAATSGIDRGAALMQVMAALTKIAPGSEELVVFYRGGASRMVEVVFA